MTGPGVAGTGGRGQRVRLLLAVAQTQQESGLLKLGGWEWELGSSPPPHSELQEKEAPDAKGPRGPSSPSQGLAPLGCPWQSLGSLVKNWAQTLALPHAP